MKILIIIVRFIGWVLLCYAGVNLVQVALGLAYLSQANKYLLAAPVFMLLVSLAILFFVKNPSDTTDPSKQRKIRLQVALIFLLAVVLGVVLLGLY